MHVYRQIILGVLSCVAFLSIPLHPSYILHDLHSANIYIEVNVAIFTVLTERTFCQGYFAFQEGHNSKIPYTPYSFKVRIRIKIRVSTVLGLGLGLRVGLGIRVGIGIRD